jgi:hypothetical protein
MREYPPGQIMNLELRYPATPDNALDHAQLAVEVAWEEFDVDLDYSPASLESVDVQVESLREEGLTGEGAAEALFVLGCYVGEVMARALGGRWVATARSPLAKISPWPMVVMLRDGSAWDPIGKVYKRLELGDSEYIPAYFAAAAASGAR